MPLQFSTQKQFLLQFRIRLRAFNTTFALFFNLNRGSTLAELSRPWFFVQLRISIVHKIATATKSTACRNKSTHAVTTAHLWTRLWSSNLLIFPFSFRLHKNKLQFEIAYVSARNAGEYRGDVHKLPYLFASANTYSRLGERNRSARRCWERHHFSSGESSESAISRMRALDQFPAFSGKEGSEGFNFRKISFQWAFQTFPREFAFARAARLALEKFLGGSMFLEFAFEGFLVFRFCCLSLPPIQESI